MIIDKISLNRNQLLYLFPLIIVFCLFYIIEYNKVANNIVEGDKPPPLVVLNAASGSQ